MQNACFAGGNETAFFQFLSAICRLCVPNSFLRNGEPPSSATHYVRFADPFSKACAQPRRCRRRSRSVSDAAVSAAPYSRESGVGVAISLCAGGLALLHRPKFGRAAFHRRIDRRQVPCAIMNPAPYSAFFRSARLRLVQLTLGSMPALQGLPAGSRSPRIAASGEPVGLGCLHTPPCARSVSFPFFAPNSICASADSLDVRPKAST